MQVVTKQDLIDFIQAQPDDREVIMMEPNSRQDCGCVMVHYGREKLGLKGNFVCSFNQWFDRTSAVAEIEQALWFIIKSHANSRYGHLFNHIKTYGDLKRNLIV